MGSELGTLCLRSLRKYSSGNSGWSIGTLAATVPRPFCCQRFQGCCSGVYHAAAGMNIWYGPCASRKGACIMATLNTQRTTLIDTLIFSAQAWGKI